MLSPLGRLYGKLINLRNSHYERGTLPSYSLGAKTVSVGNITVGGTGKTPIVAYIAALLAARGEKVCIISRGYKRRNEKKRVVVSDGNRVLAGVVESGDEPYELALKLNGKAIVIADADRVAAGKWATGEFGITAFVLDDAFQHRKAKRDLDVLVIDATNPFGNEQPLPSGILREPVENISRAGLIIVTRANLAGPTDELITKIRRYNQHAPIFTAETKISGLTGLEAFRAGKSKNIEITGAALAFCAIGNPNGFFDQLTREGIDLAHTKKFPDHHFYRPKDIDILVRLAQQHNALGLLTTAKDAVKLKNAEFTIPCAVVESELAFSDEKKLRDEICAVFKT